MSAILETLKTHGYPLIFATVLAEQLGLPLPSLPVLMAAGALVGLGHLSILPAFLVTIVAALLGDMVWYELGRRRGARILGTLCRISIEPDQCVRTTEGVFDRWGDRVLLIAKFIPGLSTVTPPVAGLAGIRLPRFLLLDTAGIALWVGIYGGMGYLLREQLEWLIGCVERVGATVLQAGLVVLVVHICFKLSMRWLFLRRLRTARISAEQLKALIDEGQQPYIADLRADMQLQADPFVIPGATVISIEKLSDRHQELPRDRPIVLYCS